MKGFRHALYEERIFSRLCISCVRCEIYEKISRFNSNVTPTVRLLVAVGPSLEYHFFPTLCSHQTVSFFLNFNPKLLMFLLTTNALARFFLMAGVAWLAWRLKISIIALSVVWSVL